ncbi:Holliday junction branch migration DNA helicase RuvB, partial [Candidatus Dojkabacteria bacterium]|nr:Holliday junction branch migration DNA helicase RuvB [Candidatus Dojkabacteria bacterium]
MIKSSKKYQRKDSPVKSTRSIDKKDLEEVETKIRPSKIDEMIGRKQEKETIKMMISSSKKRDEVMDHVLFYGPPGLGKTTFALAIANEVGSSIRITSGPAIERQGDLAAILTNLKKNDVLFIDEIHRLSRVVEEILYPAMEDRALDIVMGKGSSAKTIRLTLEPFTLIGATTQVGKISSPMRDRFGLIQRLDFFGDEDMIMILKRAADLWSIDIDTDALEMLSSSSRGTARVGLRLLRRVRDYCMSKGIQSVNSDSVKSTM